MDIWFATNNLHKKEELQAILNIKLKIPCEEGIKFDPDEIYSSFHENALLKARELKKLLGKDGGAIIADDSGLCVDALGGRPGVYSARYGEKDGKKLTSPERNSLLLEELGDNPKRSARFVCAMVLLLDDNRFFIVQETLEGEIIKSAELARGDGGFGYDPVFSIPAANLCLAGFADNGGVDRTLAELSPEEKNTISHRGKAGIQIANLLNRNGI